MLLVIIKLMTLPATLYKQMNEVLVNFSNDNSPVGFAYGAFCFTSSPGLFCLF